MITVMYAIYDEKSKIYNKPFSMINEAVAIRAVKDLTLDKNTEVGRHPYDFSLWELGTYDDETAHFVPYETKRLICMAHEIDAFQIAENNKLEDVA